MRRALVLVCLLVASCGPAGRGEGAAAAGSAPAGAIAAPAADEPGCTDATSCERGCEAGRAGDCLELADRKLRARGTAMDPAGAGRLLERACAAREPGACGRLARLQLAAHRTPTVQREELKGACAPAAGEGGARGAGAVDPEACAAAALWLLLDPERDLAEVLTLSDRGCRAGGLVACSILEELLRQASPGAICAAEGIEPPRCREELEARGRWSREEQERLRALRAMIEGTRERACRAGQWEACAPFSDEYLSAVRRACETADDHGACAELAHASSDPAARAQALRRACDRGRVPSACELRGDGLRDGVEGEPSPEAARGAYQIACDGGMASSCDKLAMPALGAGCPAIDTPDARNPTPARLGRLHGERWGGGRFDSRRDRRRRLYLFTASWNHGMRIPDAIALQQALAGRAQVVVVLSDADWSSQPAGDLEALRGMEEGTGVVALLDPPQGDENLGPQTRALGIEKVTEAMLADRDGRVRLHLAGMKVGLDRRNTVLCLETALKSGG